MYIDSNQLRNINLEFERRNAQVHRCKAGSIIYDSKDMSNQLVLLIKGQARILDNKKIFGNHTVIRTDAPQIFGLSQYFNLPYDELIRASEDSEYKILDINEWPLETISLLKDLIGSRLDQSEWAYIYERLKQKYQDKIPQIFRGIDFKRNSDVINSKESFEGKIKNLDELNYSILFIDSEVRGFKYGQSLTTEICEFSFKGSDWPRLLIYAPDTSDSPKPITKYEYNDLKEKSNNYEITKDSYEKTNDSKNDVRKNFFKGILNSDSKTSIDNFTWIRATSRRDTFYSCLKMLNEYYDLPPRSDSLQSAADYLDDQKDGWLKKIQEILDKFGLAVRSVQVDIRRPLNVPSPSLWVDNNGFCKLITKRNARSVVVIDPIEGRKFLTLTEAHELFTESSEVLAVDLGLHTPKKRFDIFWLFPYVIRYRTQLIEVFAASFLNQIFALATPLLFQQIIDRVISKGASDALTPLAILMMTCALLEVTFGTLRTFQFVEISNRIDIGVGSTIVARLLRLNARFFDSRPVGELSSRMAELTNIRNFLTGTALTVVLDAIFSLLYFSVMLYYSVSLTIVIFLTIPFLMLVTVGITPITQKLIRKRAEAASRTQSLLVEILGGIQTVKLQNAELSSRKKWEDRHLRTINQGFKAILANTGSANALQLINKVSNIVVIGFGSALVLNNELSLGELIAFRIIAGYVTQPMMRLASSWQSFQEVSLSLERVGDIVNQSLEVGENEENNIAIPEVKGSVSLENVSYEYSSSSPQVLSSVTLEIPAGSFTGFVGQSGCGKSTLLKLIPRLYRPSAGRVLIDDYDIAKVDLYSLRSQIGFVPQDCMLFEGTIFSNIALGEQNISSEEVVKMAKLACAHEFIMNLPYGYSTPIGEKGAGLSGGQRQRIALARMLLEKPRLVILDEATSALDVDTEKQVVENLRNHFSNTTLLMITHRLSTLIDADQIVVLHSGRIDAVGCHPDLMAQKGRYYALYRSQFGE